MKKLNNILFSVFYISTNIWGCEIISGQWFVPHARSTGGEISAILILVAVSSVYLLLLHMHVISHRTAIVCLISTLVLWGIPWAVASGFIVFGGLWSFFLSPSYLLVFLSLAIQYFAVLPLIKRAM